MDIENVYNLLDKLEIREKAEQECKRELDEPPTNMAGRCEIYRDFLQKKSGDLNNQRNNMIREQAYCSNSKQVLMSNSLHPDCLFNRISFKAVGACDNCKLGMELNRIDSEIEQISEACKVLIQERDKDYWSS